MDSNGIYFLNKRLIRTAVYVSEHYKITEKAAHKWFSCREQMQGMTIGLFNHTAYNGKEDKRLVKFWKF